jgi:hypothetical protein
VFWNRPVNEELIEEWWDLVKGYSWKKLDKAFTRYLSHGTVFPVPGLIIPTLDEVIG